jgi:ribosomal protein S18 acetylase RimI-like enzyme
VNTVDERARLHGAEAIQLDVLSSNVEALALYRHHGFRETALALEKRILPDATAAPAQSHRSSGRA